MVQTIHIRLQKIIAIVVFIIIGITISACSNMSILEQEVIKTKEQSYTYRDLMYTIYEVEYQCNLQDAMFGDEDFWAPDETGKTGEMYAKEMVIHQFLNQIYLYENAVDAGMSLSEEEKDSIKQDAITLLQGMQKEYVKRTGFTRESLQRAMEIKYMADQYYFKELQQIDVDVNDMVEKEKERILQERMESWKIQQEVTINEENWAEFTVRNYTCPVITEEEYNTLLEGEDMEEIQ